ncbi:hypothetical protein Cgig2_014396 [Carnegiea gigantea]|uniref:DUF8040 domain-containing protein n=1 Tax=Carnegiea gigantea TaxID=171969 RepID=A0A9Q1QB99_9CARY|nr:hypothetical protein Cgig2_014396 [Carnegiea gigantea]
MANDLNEEEVMVISAATALLGAMTALLRNYNKRDTNNEIGFSNPAVLHCGDAHCLNQIRMRPSPFFKLCEMLERRALLVNTKHMSVREQVLIFLHLICHNVRCMVIRGSSFIGAMHMISKKLNVNYLPDHDDNHLRTVKTAWGIIAKLQNQSDCGWNEYMRMIRMSLNVYNTYVENQAVEEQSLLMGERGKKRIE